MLDPKPSKRPPQDARIRLLRRALAAYYDDPETDGWPDTESSAFRTVEGLHYVVLYDQHNEGEILAAYRVRHDDKLKRLSIAHLPKGLVN